MKNKIFSLLTLFLFTLTSFANNDDLTSNFITGDPEIKSMATMAFGPQGILFIGDAQSASIIAVDTKDNSKKAAAEKLSIKNVDEAIAVLLGTTADQIKIQDMAVNPISKNIYFSVHHQNGTPVLLRTSGETFEHVPLDMVSYSKSELNHVVAEGAKDKRGRDLRRWSISDLNYADGKVMVSGLSNEEFASTFRTIAFPFSNKQQHSSLEIYHAAHGKYETHAPIKAFLPVQMKGSTHLLAGYTCTPLVVFPMNELQPGAHTKGQTVAELGNWNTPLDFISMEKDGQSYVLLANSSRALMKIKMSDIENFQGSLSERVEERSGTAGIDFINLPFVNVQQLDKYGDDNFVMLQRNGDGELNLVMQGSRWL